MDLVLVLRDSGPRYSPLFVRKSQRGVGPGRIEWASNRPSRLADPGSVFEGSGCCWCSQADQHWKDIFQTSYKTGGSPMHTAARVGSLHPLEFVAGLWLLVAPPLRDPRSAPSRQTKSQAAHIRFVFASWNGN